MMPMLRFPELRVPLPVKPQNVVPHPSSRLNWNPNSSHPDVVLAAALETLKASQVRRRYVFVD